MRIAQYITVSAALAAIFFLPACNNSGAGQSTIGRQAISVAKESRGEAGPSYSIGPQYEDEMSRMIIQEAAALGVEEGKEGVPMELNREVLLNINYFLNNARGFMTRSLSRGSKYIPMMKAIFRQKGLPEDLVYLALIESGFQTAAVSRASAVGPWQFIASTGRRYGLAINDYVDERLDPVKSTYAAADYLTALHDMFNSWPLAIAAYNSGEGKILKGMKNYGVSNFWDMSDVSGHLAAETRLYVPSFLAATFIAKDPGAYGLEIEQQAPDQWDEAVVPTPITFAEAAQMAGTTSGRLEELNPHLKKKTTPPDETDFVLRIPAGSSETFAVAYKGSGLETRAAAALPPVEPTAKAPAKTAASAKRAATRRPKASESPRLSTITHKVQRGDTLATIARLYGVPMDSIKANNNMKSNTVYRGQILRVKSDLPLTAAAPQKGRSRVMVVESKTPASAATSTYTVKKGDTLMVIAREYGMSTRELADINGVRGVTINVGQKLKVRGQAKSAAAAPASGGTHTVAKGETVYSIAKKYKLNADQLLAINPQISGNKIRVGQTLTITPPKPSGPSAHKVARGDTLYGIAAKNKLSVEALRKLNGLKGDNLRPGQTLKLR